MVSYTFYVTRCIKAIICRSQRSTAPGANGGAE